MRDRIIVALDTSDVSSALRIAAMLEGRARWLKVGMTLFYAEGPAIVSTLRSRGFDVFVDLKLHDIPHQVEGAARSLGRLGAGILSVHASGGADMMEAAVRGAAQGASEAGAQPPSVVAITVLTSMDADTLASVGVPDSTADQVVGLAALARTAGVAGVVCSPKEAASMRALLGPSALVVTPGIRPAWAAAGDQARFDTPGAALSAGASHLVIGRPITDADDPAAAFDRIVSEG
jgi:orotidine-5'-phosphate decarboxylase